MVSHIKITSEKMPSNAAGMQEILSKQDEPEARIAALEVAQ